jgi:hypothetical protein
MSDAVTAADAIRRGRPMMCERCGREPEKPYFRGLNVGWICFSTHPG